MRIRPRREGLTGHEALLDTSLTWHCRGRTAARTPQEPWRLGGVFLLSARTLILCLGWDTPPLYPAYTPGALRPVLQLLTSGGIDPGTGATMKAAMGLVFLVAFARTTAATATPPVTGQTRWDMAVMRFVAGDLAGGLALAQECSTTERACQSGRGDMEEFLALSKKLEALDTEGMSRLLALDKAITGKRGPSQFLQNAGPRVAEVFYRSAQKAKNARQWARAVEHSRRALEAVPGHTGARGLLDELRRKALHLYESHFIGYRQKDSSPEDALPIYREIMALTVPEDELHQKARSWVEKLER